MPPTPQQKTVVVGAGPVGALAALYAARRGDAVEIYELRDGKLHQLRGVFWKFWMYNKKCLSILLHILALPGFCSLQNYVFGLKFFQIPRGIHPASQSFLVKCGILRLRLLSDLRHPSTVPLNFTKSINLALSERGINSMRRAECPDLIVAALADTIPMHGRMIHGEKLGNVYEQSQAYDVRGKVSPRSHAYVICRTNIVQYIRAIDRAGLNKRLLDELEKMSNVKFYFNHKLTGADFNRKIAWFEQRSKNTIDHRPPEVEVKFDFMIGADGAHSAVRFHLMKFARMSYQQEYIDTLWCEFRIDPSSSGTFKLSPNHLHIWPGQEFMFIAIPSLDNSFTCTLFLPASRFAELDSSNLTLLDFFKTHFPGVVPDLISETDLEKQYKENPHLPLISIKCAPFHYSSSVVILGDAAHAMVPFYGQGMNAGLEDVRVLYDFLDSYRPTPGSLPSGPDGMRGRALSEYSRVRVPDAHVINDLALRNYQEMRSDVTSHIYKLRKWIEEKISISVPMLGWATQYSRISFGNERYSEVERKAHEQGKVLLRTMTTITIGLMAGGSWWLWRWNMISALGGRFAQWMAVLGANMRRLGLRSTYLR